MCDLLLGDAVGDLIVEARGGAYDVDVGIGVQAVEDAASRYLELVSVNDWQK